MGDQLHFATAASGRDQDDAGHGGAAAGHLPQGRFGVARDVIVLIEERTFFRQCVIGSLQATEPGHAFEAFESVAAWHDSAVKPHTSILILWMAEPYRGDAGTAFRDQIGEVLGRPGAPPVVVMSDHDGRDDVAQVMASGARAFLPASMGVDMAMKVLDLVRAGGSFVPASALVGGAGPAAESSPAADDLRKLFSPRQLAVVRAMRKGQPNKIIAYELSMCESTVKVHVRTIMKKLNARNRTEVAFLTRGLDGDADERFAV